MTPEAEFPTGRPPAINFLTEDRMGDDPLAATVDPGVVVMTCANCGALMDERTCKLICDCGYFLSCSDYY